MDACFFVHFVVPLKFVPCHVSLMAQLSDVSLRQVATHLLAQIFVDICMHENLTDVARDFQIQRGGNILNRQKNCFSRAQMQSDECIVIKSRSSAVSAHVNVTRMPDFYQS